MVDKELSDFRHQIGNTAYRRQYETLYRFAEQSTRRNSGKEYENTKDHLQSLKEKYKNGVNNDIIKEMVGM